MASTQLKVQDMYYRSAELRHVEPLSPSSHPSGIFPFLFLSFLFLFLSFLSLFVLLSTRDMSLLLHS